MSFHTPTDLRIVDPRPDIALRRTTDAARAAVVAHLGDAAADVLAMLGLAVES